MRSSTRAFTLLELLIVLLIIGILIAIGLYRYQSVVETGYAKQAQSALRAGMIHAESVRTRAGEPTYDSNVNNLVNKLEEKPDGLSYLSWANAEPDDTGPYASHINASEKNLLVSLQPQQKMVVFCNRSKAGKYYCLGTASASVNYFAASSPSFTSASDDNSLSQAYCALATPSGSLPRGCGGNVADTSDDNGHQDGDEIRDLDEAGLTPANQNEHSGGNNNGWLGTGNNGDNDNGAGNEPPAAFSYDTSCASPYNDSSITDFTYSADGNVTIVGTKLDCFDQISIGMDAGSSYFYNPASNLLSYECGSGIDVTSWSSTKIEAVLMEGYFDGKSVLGLLAFNQGSQTNAELSTNPPFPVSINGRIGWTCDSNVFGQTN